MTPAARKKKENKDGGLSNGEFTSMGRFREFEGRNDLIVLEILKWVHYDPFEGLFDANETLF